MQDRDAGELSEPPTHCQLCFAADALSSLASARCASEGAQLQLQRAIDADEQAWRNADRCDDCGGSLAHAAGAGVSAVLCPTCDADRLDELGELGELGELAEPDLEGELCLSVELAQLGKDAARDAWVEHAGELHAVPRDPEARAWQQLGAALEQLEGDRALDAGERRVFVQAYENELRALAASGRQHARGFALSVVLLALLVLVLTACADEPRSSKLEEAPQVAPASWQAPTLPLDVYLLDDCADDAARVFREVVDAWNEQAGLELLVLRDEPPAGRCGVYVSPGTPADQPDPWSSGTCVMRVGYDPCNPWCTAGHQLGHALGLGHRPDTLMEAEGCTFAMPGWKIGVDLDRLLAERAMR
jgi:hypothetical protein